MKRSTLVDTLDLLFARKVRFFSCGDTIASHALDDGPALGRSRGEYAGDLRVLDLTAKVKCRKDGSGFTA